MKRSVLALAALLTAAYAASAQGPITSSFTYQGELRQSGTPVSTPVDLRFRLYDSPDLGHQVGPELSASLVPSTGRFTVDLDFGDVFTGQATWLEIDTRAAGTTTFTTLSPRMALTAAPAASFARTAASASSLTLPFEAVSTIPSPGCVFSITSTSPFSPAICGNNTSPGGASFGIQGYAASPAGTGVYGYGATGIRGESTFPNGSGVFGYSANPGGIGISGNAETGIRGESPNPNGNGVVGYASGGNDAWAVSGQTATGQAVIGRAGVSPPGGGFPPGTGVVGYTDVSTGFVSGIGVYGEAAATTGPTYGAYFKNASNSGTAVRGWATANNSQTYGGDFACGGNAGATAVHGDAYSTSGITYGGDFSAESTDGIGVRAKANALTGFTWGGWLESKSSTGKGVLGTATSPTGATYGVYGSTSSSNPLAYGVFASGNLGSNGTKSFRIDHPMDPDNKYLLHYCVESPEVLNTYSGKVIIDALGEATVQMPTYFAAVNKDPRYTLTPIGAAMPLLHIAQEIDESLLTAGATAAPGQAVPICRFRIGGGMPGAKVSWRIEAVRNDRWVREHGAPTEIQKQPEDQRTPEQNASPPN